MSDLKERLRKAADEAEVACEGHPRVKLMREAADAIERMERDAERYLKAFEHIHVARQDGSDVCKQCGLDLRDMIHKRWPIDAAKGER